MGARIAFAVSAGVRMGARIAFAVSAQTIRTPDHGFP
jgi:hypothetical protein